MQTAQPRPRATASRRTTVGLVIFIVAFGAGCATLISSLIIQHTVITFSFHVSFWIGIFLFVHSRWRQPHQRRLVWIFALALGILYITIVAGFIWYLPLALALLGSFLALVVVPLFAQWTKPTSISGWMLLLGCGLLGGAAGALVFWLMLGYGVINLPMLLLLTLVAGLAGLTGGALRHASDTFWPRLRRGRNLSASEPAPAASAPLSRRDVLLGLGGLAGLAATGAGFTWLSRSLLAHAFPLLTYKSFNYVQRLSWSPDGRRIVSILGEFEGGTITIWDTFAKKEIISYRDAEAKGYYTIRAVAWSPDGTRIALGSKYGLFLFTQPKVNAAIIDATTLRPIVTFNAGKPEIHAGVFAIAWSPDGTRVATTAGVTQVWDVATGKQLLSFGAGIFILAWSPDGSYLVTDNEFNAQVWDAESGELLTTHRGHTAFIQTVAWSPDSTKIASSSLDDTVQVWEARSRRHLLTYHADSYQTINTVAWSPDGSRIASAGLFGDVHVWDAATGEQVFLYKGHTQEVNALAWSPDGTRIASGGYDKTVQVWQSG